MRAGEGSPGSESHAARVAFICTANRARSPFAAALLEARIGEGTVVVESFGMLDQRGAPALPGAVRAAAEFGIDLSQHHARQLLEGTLGDADLTIGFEPAHLSAAVAAGASPARSFLLAELSQVLEFDVLPWPSGSDSLESRIAHANARRYAGGWLPRAVADPVGGSDRVFMETFDEIDRAVAVIGARLFGTSVARTG